MAAIPMNRQPELAISAPLGASSDPRLLGRDAEVAFLHAAIDNVPNAGTATVIRGDPGIGKTALLNVAEHRALARGLRVLKATGVQSEADLAFSGLHQLLSPIMADRRRPGRQGDALDAAFGLIDMEVADQYLVGLATLDLLADTAEQTPLLVVCEDAQWLDRPTLTAMSFVARRIGSEPIAVLAAIRDGHPGVLDQAEMTELRPAPLDDQASHQLLDKHRLGLSQHARRRVLRTAGGNPLALIELPDEPLPTPDQGLWQPNTDAPSLTARLERAFAAQQEQLPPDTRAVLLVAATDQEVVLAEVLAASSQILGEETSVDVLGPAVAGDLVAIDGERIAFRHPLIRSAIYQSASVNARRAAHAALAAVLREQPDRRTWHQAATCVGPDQQVVTDLEQLAERLARRGATTVAAKALVRAAELAPTAPRRVELLLQAAEIEFELGRAAAVEQLVKAAEKDDPDPRQRATITWLRDIFTDGVPGDPAPVRALTKTAEECCGTEIDLALKLLLGAALRSWWKDPGEPVRDSVVAVADRVSTNPLDPRLIAVIAVCASVTRGSDAVLRLGQLQLTPDQPHAAYLAGMAAHAVGHYELAATSFDVAQRGLRGQGRLAVLCQVLTMCAWDLILLGDWNAAAAAAEEGYQLATETGQPIWSAGAALARAVLAGVQGDAGTAEELVAEAEETTIARGLSALQCCGALARGVAALGQGRHAEAFDYLRRMFDPHDPAFHRADRFMGIGYLADAALHGGQREFARTKLLELKALAQITQSPALELGIIYSEPILADDEVAEDLYQAALIGLKDWPFMRARLHLSYGAWLRRQRRIAESRAPLRRALTTFDGLGARAWSERTRQELTAAGETKRERAEYSYDELTPQELQIAQMAAAGLSNREIAQQLYLSHRTVATHLYRAFPKLSIASRSQLQAALDQIEARYNA